MKYLPLLLVLTACGPGMIEKPPIQYGIDPAFQSYSDEFNAQYSLNQAVPIHFAELDYSPTDNTVGECIVYSDGERQILIEQSAWNSYNTDLRQELIFHELGHCVFNRLHTTALLSDGCPASIMYPYLFGDPCYSLHLTEYFNELVANAGH